MVAKIASAFTCFMSEGAVLEVTTTQAHRVGRAFADSDMKIEELVLHGSGGV